MKTHVTGRGWSTILDGGFEVRLSIDPKEIIIKSATGCVFYSQDQVLDVVGDERLLLPRAGKGGK